MEFNDIIGHNQQKALLASLVEKDKLPHALLFSGPNGVGKRTLATAFVRNLYCENGNGCMNCRACRNLAAGVHPDFLTIAGETTIKIDEMRAVKKEVSEFPYEAPVRVILINDAEKMTREAANALLKTLEEPPPGNLFILVTSQEQELPLTVRSRCMRLGFGPLPCDLLESYFKTSLKVDATKAGLLASLGNGSIATGLFWKDKKNFEFRQIIADILTARKKSFTNATLIAERITKDGNEKEYLSFLLTFFRDVWWLNHEGSPTGLVNRDLSDLLQERAGGLTRWAEESIQHVRSTMKIIRYNVNRWLALEQLMCQLMENTL